MKLFRPAVLATAIALAGVSPGGAAAASQPLRIDGYWLREDINGFTTTAGPLCASGNLSFTVTKVVDTGVGNGAAVDLFGGHWNLQAWNHAPALSAFGTTTFTCPDGTLTVDWHVVGTPSDMTPAASGRFSVVGATGAYAGFAGEGVATWAYSPGGIILTFDGEVR